MVKDTPMNFDEVKLENEKLIPKILIKAINSLLVDKFNPNSVSIDISFREIKNRVLKLDPTLSEESAKYIHLDFENVFNQYWNIEKIYPDNFDYIDAYVKFTKK